MLLVAIADASLHRDQIYSRSKQLRATRVATQFKLIPRLCIALVPPGAAA